MKAKAKPTPTPKPGPSAAEVGAANREAVRSIAWQSHARGGRSTNKAIAAAAGISEATCGDHVAALRAAGLYPPWPGGRPRPPADPAVFRAKVPPTEDEIKVEAARIKLEGLARKRDEVGEGNAGPSPRFVKSLAGASTVRRRGRDGANKA